MEQLVQLVSQRTGLSEDKARAAVDTVVGFLKERLPGGLGSQLDGVIAGGGSAGGTNIGDVASGVGSIFGSDKR